MSVAKLCWLLDSAVVMICFTALAVHFDKWWLVLFAMLFFPQITTVQKEK